MSGQGWNGRYAQHPHMSHNPGETGQRWPEVPRGWLQKDSTNDGAGERRLFDSAPPINPATGVPWRGALIAMDRAGLALTSTGTITRTGGVVIAIVGDPSGARAYRRFIIGPNAPVYLALGQYANARVLLVDNAQPTGGAADPLDIPASILWVDREPALPDVGILQSPPIEVAAGVETAVPDGAVFAEFETTTTVIWRDYTVRTAGGGGKFFPWTNSPAAGAKVRVQGQSFTLPAIASNVRFYLAGL